MSIKNLNMGCVSRGIEGKICHKSTVSVLILTGFIFQWN